MIIHRSEADFYARYYRQLVGCKLVDVSMPFDEDADSIWPTFTMEAPDGTTFDVELAQDPEGNGPGFLFGLPYVNKEATT